MVIWDYWKKGFDAWESSTANLLEEVLKSPVVLEPSGTMLTALMKAKALSDRTVAQGWAAIGLPTRIDQERSLHALNQLQGRLTDLEDKIVDLETELSEARRAAPTPLDAPRREADAANHPRREADAVNHPRRAR